MRHAAATNHQSLWQISFKNWLDRPECLAYFDVMTINVTPEQESIIQREIVRGNFRDVEDVLDHALAALLETAPNPQLPAKHTKSLVAALREPPFAGSEFNEANPKSLTSRPGLQQEPIHQCPAYPKVSLLQPIEHHPKVNQAISRRSDQYAQSPGVRHTKLRSYRPPRRIVNQQ